MPSAVCGPLGPSSRRLFVFGSITIWYEIWKPFPLYSVSMELLRLDMVLLLVHRPLLEEMAVKMLSWLKMTLGSALELSFVAVISSLNSNSDQASQFQAAFRVLALAPSACTWLVYRDMRAA